MIYVIPLSICLALHKYLMESGYKTTLLPHHDGSDSGKRRIDNSIKDDRTLLVSENDKLHVDYIRQKEYSVTFMGEFSHAMNTYTINDTQRYLNLLTVDSVNQIADKMEFKYKPSWIEIPSRLGVIPYWTFRDWEALGAIERRIVATANNWFPDRDRAMSVNVVFRNDNNLHHTYSVDHDTDTTDKTAKVISATIRSDVLYVRTEQVPAIEIVVRVPA